MFAFFLNQNNDLTIFTEDLGKQCEMGRSFEKSRIKTLSKVRHLMKLFGGLRLKRCGFITFRSENLAREAMGQRVNKLEGKNDYVGTL